ncbi:MAG TPA: ATP-dependent RecD-like DNA helicase [Victivallales bacterium]|nr:ATP-dependent RecD-like DNA helicase [Victivallales bacterium]HPO90116.1 ATP-dependent RecD-like DNA helicase [Victivallales bacterium]HRU00843.1 ATP-dependent RecD-like DNA helicase [Victivallales bacterium]
MENNENNIVSNTQHILCGEITKLVFTSDEGGYSVIRVRDEKGIEHTVVGPFSGAFEGQCVEIVGFWEKHKEFGRQLRAENVKFTLPKTPEGIKKYLASGLIPGIGEKLAECIVNHFGVKTLDILDNYSSRLLEIPGFGKKRLEMIRKAWSENSQKREIFIFLQSLGISIAYAQKIYRIYGDNTPSIVKENPYRLADEVQGIGFTLSDRIASALGIGKENIFRLTSGVVYCLKRLSEEGHVCYPEDKLIEYSSNILGVSDEKIKDGIENAIKEKLISKLSTPDGCEFRNALYFIGLEIAEKGAANALIRIAKSKKHRCSILKNINLNFKIPLNDLQKRAVEGVAIYPLNIITGGPGVGKTTVISEIVRRAKIAKLRVYLCAPTGRAAKRMSEACNHPAMTIHRMLKWEPERHSFIYNEYRPLNCDLLIIDEVSMLDIQLAYFLFRAVASETTVIMVGDSDQLPSVGPGNVLSDLIRSGIAFCTRLTQIYRQLSGSRIISNAHLVNSGVMPDISPVSSDKLSDFYWIDCDDPVDTAKIILKLLSSRIPKRFGFNPMKDIQVLSPMNKGECGTANLNIKIQSVLNPENLGRPQFRFGETVFRSGDRVMQISNNYDKSVFNGEMGRIVHIDYREKKFNVEFDNFTVNYDFIEADQIVHCYATTIHKAQGCEFPAVIVPVLTQHYIMLRRNLIYTAITRAKRLLVLIGSKKALSIAIKNVMIEKRYTLLRERLLGMV